MAASRRAASQWQPCKSSGIVWRWWSNGMGWNTTQSKNWFGNNRWQLECSQVQGWYFGSACCTSWSRSWRKLCVCGWQRKPHRARVVDDHLQTHGIERMVWPAKSPDLNPIEHVWAFMKFRISQRLQPHHRLADLRRMVVEEWDRVPIAYINRLIRSMNMRARQVVQYHGGYTDY